MVGWHHRFNGRGFGWSPGVDDGQGGLACCGSQGHKESDTTERLNRTGLGVSDIGLISLVLGLGPMQLSVSQMLYMTEHSQHETLTAEEVEMRESPNL